MKVFVDTAAWIALLNTNDNLHQKAIQIRDRLQQQKVSLLTESTESTIFVEELLMTSRLR